MTVQTIQRSYFYYLENFVNEHIETLSKAKIFIFGAGVRGCNLLWVLRSHQLSDVLFVDNNAVKQGVVLEGCSVLSFEEASQYTGRTVFLCPVENGSAILTQLEAAGYRENEDYFNLDFFFTDYLDLIQELKEPATEYSMLFGSCELSSYILEECALPPLGEILRKQVFPEACKVCTLPGFYTPIYYYTINACLHIQKHSPRSVVILMELSSLSPHEPLMMGAQNYQQHKQFIEQLAEMIPLNQELKEYLQKINRRLERSTIGSSPTKADNTLDAQKRVYRLKYLYHLRKDDESVVYTKKILAQMNQLGIPVTLLFPPVDYQRGEEICGKDFREKYSKVIMEMLSFLSGMKYQYIDASFIATSDYFVPPTTSPDINPFLNAKGQQLLSKFLNGHLQKIRRW